MSENPQVVNQGVTDPNLQDDIFARINNYNVIGTIEHIYDVLPRVFIDGYTLSKISLTDQFVNCGKYESRSGLTFEGCVQYKNNELTDVRGIYYVANAPIYYFATSKKISRDENEMKEIILSNIKSLSSHIKLGKRLLIHYDNYGISIYDRFVKGKIIKFPLSAQQGHLFVLWVPRVPMELEYEKVNSIEVYNHRIELEREVIRFKVNVLGGQGDLLYNNTEDHIRGTIKSPDHEQKEVELMHGSFYLITHPRSAQRRNVD